MHPEGYSFQGQEKLVTEENALVVQPLHFVLVPAPDADLDNLENAGRAVMKFLMESHQGGGGYDY